MRTVSRGVITLAAASVCGLLSLQPAAQAALLFVNPGTQIVPTTVNHNITITEAADESLGGIAFDGVNIAIINLPLAQQVATALGRITKAAVLPKALVNGTLTASDAAGLDTPGKISDIFIFRNSNVLNDTTQLLFISDPTDGSPAETEIGSATSRVVIPTFPFVGTATTSFTVVSPAECAAPAPIRGPVVCPPPETEEVTLSALPEPSSLAVIGAALLALIGFTGISAASRKML